jgi:hypothetical protein
MTAEDWKSFDNFDFLSELLKLEKKTKIMQQKLEIVFQSLHNKKEDDYAVVLNLTEENMFGRMFQIRSSEAFACAIYAFLRVITILILNFVVGSDGPGNKLNSCSNMGR